MVPCSVIGFAGQPVQLTHSCKFLCLPHHNALHHGFFNSTITHTLFSLGYLQRQHGTFNTIETPNRIGINIYSPDGTLLDEPTLAPNNTYPCSSIFLRRNWLASSAHVQPLANPATVTNEQIKRCHQVNDLLESKGYPSDQDLKRDISFGKVDTHLTSQDITLNRKLLGPCVIQAAGKYTTAPALPSTHQLATRVTEFLHIDGHKLPTPATGGFTHKYLVVDQHSGKADTILTKSNKSADVFAALDTHIACEYEAYGHIPGTIRGDDESINESLRPLLGSRTPHPVLLQLNTPLIHAQLNERTNRTVNNRSRCIAAPLPYILPAKHFAWLSRYACHALNNSVHDRISPFTPNEIALGRKFSIPPLPFGRSAMIPVSKDKNVSLAKLYDIPFKILPKVELGVVLGPDTKTSGTFFLTDNGSIISRNVKGLKLLPKTFIPFNLPRSPYFPTVSLPTTSTQLDDSPPPGFPAILVPTGTHDILPTTDAILTIK